MSCVSVEVQDEDLRYVYATFDGNRIEKYWKDPFLKTALEDAVKEAGKGRDIFDLAVFVYGMVLNATRRRYSGQEFQLKEIMVVGPQKSVTIER